MSSSRPLDRIRAWVQGELSPAATRELERELASDPQLARLAAEFRAVHAQTAAEPSIPAPRTEIDELFRRMEHEEAAPSRPVLPRRVAVAAAMLVALGGAWLVGDLGRSEEDASRPLVLEHIAALESFDRAPIELVPMPARLASWSPVRDGEIQWLNDLDEAHATARATGRLVFLFGSLPGCSMCEQLRQTTFQDESLLRAAEEYVPVEIDLSQLSDIARETLMATGYPVLLLQSPEGQLVRKLSGLLGLEAFREGIWGAVEEHDPERELMGWEEVHELATLSSTAEEAESEGRLGAAWVALGELEDAGGAGAFGERARAARERISRSAAELVRAARAADSNALALAALEPQLTRFAGTPFESDLERLRATLAGGGSLHELRFASE